MFSIFRKPASVDNGAFIVCPRCDTRGHKKYIESYGNIDVYRCTARGINSLTGQPARCNLTIKVVRTPMPSKYGAEELKARPGLMFGR